MKHFLISYLLFFLVCMSSAQAKLIDCFIVKDAEKYLIQEGNSCDTRYSPASTFKIPLALMGYESKILKDENHPIWKSKEPITYLQDYWSGEKTPLSWMKYSIVWYSQILTTKLGMKNFQIYVDKLDYGNKDLSGTPGKNDGLTGAWLSNSLLISPVEQINFIEKLAKNQLPFSVISQTKTKNLIRLFEESLLSNGWKLYGKTGSDFDQKSKEKRGYFIGFGEKSGKIISFVIHISGDSNSKVSGIYAKKMALEKMVKIFNQD